MIIRTIFGALLWVSSLASLVACGALGSRALTISDFPTCGLTCLLITVPASGCSLSDVSCQCSNAELSRASAACLLANCTMAETLDTAKVQADLCHLPNESKTNDMYIYTIAAYSIGIFFVVLRLISKVAVKRVSADDWVLLLAVLVVTPPVACVLQMSGNGFGEHLWNLQHGQLLEDLRLFYVASSIYTVALGLIKISLCMFYLQIFPTPRIRIVCYVIMGWIIVNTLIIFLLTIFSCTPIQAFWNRDVGGKCMDINALAYANSACAIAQDVVLVLFPLCCIRKLNMKRYRKFAVGFMFCVGTFGCITTMIRLHTLLAFGNSIDPTWDYVPVTIWTELELASGFVCACLPAVRILLVMIIPKSLLTSLTSRSKSRSHSAPTPGLSSSNSRKPERKTLSWLHVLSANNDSVAHTDRSRSSRLWPGTSPIKSPRSRAHQRLGSSQGHHDDFDMAHIETYPPSSEVSRGVASEEEDRVLELPDISASRRQNACYSCGPEDEVISALPPIGCLPDESFSEHEQRRVKPAEGRWWEEVRRSIERGRSRTKDKGDGV